MANAKPDEKPNDPIVELEKRVAKLEAAVKKANDSKAMIRGE